MIPLFKPFINDVEILALKGILDCNVNEGEKTARFEKSVAKRCGREYGIAVTSGTVALTITAKFSLFHETIVPDYCVLSPYNAVKMAGKIPELADIDKKTLCITDMKRENRNTLVVHFNNHKCSGIRSVHVIHDISHCIGTNFSDIEGTLCISFSAPKSVTTGQGGMILTNDQYLANEIRRYKNHGRLTDKDEMKDFGTNYKFNDILASVGIAQMEKLDYILNEKHEINKEYNRHIKTYNPDIPWTVIYMSKNAHGIEKYLNENDIMAKCLYKPINMLIGYGKDDYENSRWAWENLVYLPAYIGLTKDEIKFVCGKINEYESKNN